MSKRRVQQGKKFDHQGADPTVYRAIQGRIGQELRAYYKPLKGLPHRLLALLIQLNPGRKRRTRAKTNDQS
jgi:hypothetical protein